MIAGSLIMALQTVVSRNIDPTQTAIVTVGTVHAGTAANVIPESAKLELSIRSFDEGVRAKLEQRITELVTAQVMSYGGSVEIEYQPGYPVLVNTTAETAFAKQVAEELVGPQLVIAPYGPVTGSEDFAYFLQHKPGCFLRIGNGEHSPMVHNAKFDFDDANLTVGAAYWTRLAERFLQPAG
jgi:hippurate hydrolase